MTKRSIGLGLTIFFVLFSAALSGWLAWTMHKAGLKILPDAGTIELISSANFVTSWLAIATIYFASIYGFAAQSVFHVIIAGGLYFRQTWARWFAVAYGLFVLIARGWLWIALVQKYGIAKMQAPVTLGTILTILIVIYLIRPGAAHLFDKAKLVSKMSAAV